MQCDKYKIIGHALLGLVLLMRVSPTHQYINGLIDDTLSWHSMEEKKRMMLFDAYRNTLSEIDLELASRLLNSLLPHRRLHWPCA